MSNICQEGSKIRLIQMGEDPAPMPNGATGTVKHITPFFHGYILTVDWDAPNNTRKLNICLPEDKIEVIHV